MSDTPIEIDPSQQVWLEKISPLLGVALTAQTGSDLPPLDLIDLGQAATWESRKRRIEPELTQVLSNRLGDHSRIRASWSMAVELANKGKHAEALRILERLEPEITEAITKGMADFDNLPGDVVPIAKARLAWMQARKKMFGQLAVVEQKIVAICSSDPTLSHIVAETPKLFDNLINFDERLDNALNAVINAPPGQERDDRKGEARSVIGDYQTELENPFFKDIDGNNGFANVAVTATAQAALGAIVRVLS